MWIYGGNYVRAAEAIYSPFRIFHSTEDHFAAEYKRMLSPAFFANMSRIVRRIDLMVAVSEGVRESWVDEGGYTGPCLVLENGCDFAFWERFRGEGRQRRNNVAFYQGGINYRLDYELINELVGLLPDWEFWFCGGRDPKDIAWAAIAGRPECPRFRFAEPRAGRREILAGDGRHYSVRQEPHNHRQFAAAQSVRIRGLRPAGGHRSDPARWSAGPTFLPLPRRR